MTCANFSVEILLVLSLLDDFAYFIKDFIKNAALCHPILFYKSRILFQLYKGRDGGHLGRVQHQISNYR